MANFIFSVEKTSNESIVKFVANQVLTNGSFEYGNIEEAQESPLSQQLFHLPFVKKVYITANFVAIEKYNIVEWNEVENGIKERLENFLNEGGQLLKETAKKPNLAVEVYAEITPNPAVMKFVSNKLLVTEDQEYKNIEEAKNSPLAQDLFNFPFIKEVFISQNYISITKYDIVEWNEITMELRSFIRTYILDEKPVVIISEQKQETTQENKVAEPVNLDETSEKIVAILDEYVKPAVASDGGNILFKEYNPETKVVSVILQGACSGCPSSTITLKNGIETMLKEMLPNQIEEVVAINQ
ncbi:NifU family protein [Aureivirga sp. CE67]|uniref:NifU family protein n=1 Tax=Aureivirga sp. CE67 TaxID=1788983 RepID=UPI0018CA837F|nr:NifU family protein [Aureivirga sp. CE67]